MIALFLRGIPPDSIHTMGNFHFPLKVAMIYRIGQCSSSSVDCLFINSFLKMKETINNADDIELKVKDREAVKSPEDIKKGFL